jgi:DNA-directed RNA polymerase subunit beta'
LLKNGEGESVKRLDLTEEEYLNILDTLPADNQYLDDFDPNKFVAKMGAECIMDLLARIDLMNCLN